jgi:hypothetical protein
LTSERDLKVEREKDSERDLKVERKKEIEGSKYEG